MYCPRNPILPLNDLARQGLDHRLLQFLRVKPQITQPLDQ